MHHNSDSISKINNIIYKIRKNFSILSGINESTFLFCNSFNNGKKGKIYKNKYNIKF
jgi:hypothetical protein